MPPIIPTEWTGTTTVQAAQTFVHIIPLLFMLANKKCTNICQKIIFLLSVCGRGWIYYFILQKLTKYVICPEQGQSLTYCVDPLTFTCPVLWLMTSVIVTVSLSVFRPKRHCNYSKSNLTELLAGLQSLSLVNMYFILCTYSLFSFSHISFLFTILYSDDKKTKTG